MLSKKHYIAIAGILNRTKANRKTVIELANYFRKDNPNFEVDTFIKASLFWENREIELRRFKRELKQIGVKL